MYFVIPRARSGGPVGMTKYLQFYTAISIDSALASSKLSPIR